MFGLPSNIDLSFLNSKMLQQICFGEHDLILNFEEPISISITSEIGLTLPEGKKQIWEDFRQGAGFLVSLLSNTVESVRSTPEGTLTLNFTEGGTLEIYDNSEQFESYVITNGDNTIVV